ncbi:MAG: hypothetical protein M1480_10905 [Bacteroidetes bacterium]|nr:hypothetical protein [Bacteroidota bacterium]
MASLFSNNVIKINLEMIINHSPYACAKESLLYLIGESLPKVDKSDTGKGKPPARH